MLKGLGTSEGSQGSQATTWRPTPSRTFGGEGSLGRGWGSRGGARSVTCSGSVETKQPSAETCSGVIDIGATAARLKQRGEHTSTSMDLSRVFYPDRGNAACFEIEAEPFWLRHRTECILSAMRRFPPVGPVFDVGGGNGFVAKAIVEAGFQAILVEPGMSGISNARRRGLKPVIQSTVECAGFRESSLSAIGLFDVLEHIEDDLRLLRLARRLLVPSGILSLTVPAHQLLWSHADAASGHFRRYRVSTLRRLLLKTGWKPVFATYFFAILPLLMFVFRCLPHYLGFRRGQSCHRPDARCNASHASSWWRRIGCVLKWDRTFLSRGRSLPFGASCLVVAKHDLIPVNRGRPQWRSLQEASTAFSSGAGPVPCFRTCSAPDRSESGP